MGVNQFTVEEKGRIETLKIDEAVQKKQVEKLRKLRSKRDKKKVEAALAALKKVAEGDGNIMYPILECVRARMTVGEIMDALRGVFGEYKEPLVF